MRIEVTGAPLDLADDLEESFLATAKAAIGRCGDVLLAEVRERLSQTGEPVAGGPPRKRTGELMDSFKRIAPRVRGRVATSGIRTSHEGAGRLEYGETDTRGIHTLPHPYLGPAMEAVEAEVTQILNASVLTK